MNTKVKEAQIMLISLIVLVILALVIVSLVILLNRDLVQISTSNKYQRIYNAAENEIAAFVNKYGADYRPLANISESSLELENDPNSGCVSPIITETFSEVRCEFSSNKYGGKDVDFQVVMEDTKVVESLELRKDSQFALNLNDGVNIYRDELLFEWDENFALEMALAYENPQTGLIEVKTDIFDLTDDPNAFDSLVTDDPFNPNDVQNVLGFEPVTSNLNFSYKITVGEILAPDQVPLHLVITPRSKDAEFIKLNVYPSNITTFPYQLRNFSVVAYDSLDLNTPLVKLKSVSPLLQQIDSIFQYSLITNGNLSL